MTAPAVTSILDLIAARLAIITTTNGYNYTITNIERAKLTPFKSEDLPAINYWSTGLENSRKSYMKDERSLPLYIEAHTKTHDEVFTDVASKLAADIITALNRKTTAPKVSDTITLTLMEKYQIFFSTGMIMKSGEDKNHGAGF